MRAWEAIYLHDPDINGIELAWDRAREEWPQIQTEIGRTLFCEFLKQQHMGVAFA